MDLREHRDRRAVLRRGQGGPLPGAAGAEDEDVADIAGQAILHALYEQMLRHEAVIDRYELAVRVEQVRSLPARTLTIASGVGWNWIISMSMSSAPAR